MRGVLVTTIAAAALVLSLPVLFAATGAEQSASASAAGAIGGSCTVTVPDRPADQPDRPVRGVVQLGPDQMNNARTIAAVARGRQLPERAAAIALMTAMQESSLTNVNHGDLAGPTSRGLFQQKPEYYPGVDVLDAGSAAAAFYERLVAVPEYLSVPMWAAAQAVQRSADGTLYQRWSEFGEVLAAALYGRPNDAVACTGGDAAAGPAAPASDRVQKVLEAARTQLGVWYVWAGGNSAGPTTGQQRPCTAGPSALGCGFDCSGLVLYAWAKVGINLPHSSRQQYNAGQRVPIGQAKVGDLIFLANSTDNPATIHHVAMIYAPGQIIEAQQTGVPVHVRIFRGPAEPEIMPYAVRLFT